MVYTFFELQRQVLRPLDEESNDSTREVVKGLLNHAHQMRCNEARWPFLLSKEYTLAVPAGASEIALHAEMERLVYIRQVGNETPLEERPMRATELGTFELTADAPTNFSLWGVSPVRVQPSSASVVSVVSTSSADTGSTFNVAVKGEDANGNVVVDVITPNGATAVAGTRAFTRILAITRSAQTTGTLTFSYADNTEALILQPWEMGKAYPLITLNPTPNTDVTLAYRFYRQPLLMVNDYDIPDIPGTHALILVWDVLTMMGAYVADIPSQAIAKWENFREEAETALWNAYIDGQTLNTRTKTVRRVRGD